MAKVLVADDERAICEAFRQWLNAEGHTPLVASSGREALELADREHPAAVFLDVRMPGMGGLETLGKLRARHPNVPVVVMTAYGTLDTAMDAVRLGAFDYVGKPVELAQIRDILSRALHKPDSTPSSTLPDTQEQGALVGQSAAMQEIYKLMVLLTTNDLTVLITGESGVGKELVARGIHTHGPRRSEPFAAVNCATIPEQLLESELFGHERGAFTGAESRRIGRFEAAGEGTMFLDDIAELPRHLQSKLLRVLQERSFEPVGSVRPIALQARILAASNRDLDSEVREGNFREDLYHRLKLVTVYVPPLRERREDIPLLALHFTRLASRELGKSVDGIEPAALRLLQQPAWSGNVRELEHTIKRAVLLARGHQLTAHDLELPTVSAGTGATALDTRLEQMQRAATMALQQAVSEGVPSAGNLYHRLVTATEEALIDEALRLSDGNQVAASKLLGLHRTTLRKKLQERRRG